jgi:hypothetical protein
MLIQVEKEMTDAITPLMSAHLHHASDSYTCACIRTISFPGKGSLHAVLKNVGHDVAAAPSAFPEIYLIEYYIMHLLVEVYIVE